MNIVSVRYRFLRLGADKLALVELYPFSNKPERCGELYPEYPYLSSERMQTVKLFMSLEDWVQDCKEGFELAVEEAKLYPIIDYRGTTGEQKGVLLWNYLDPLEEEIFWDEYVPLFDNDYNFILRND